MLLALACLLFQDSGYPAYAVPRLEGVTIKGLPPVTGRICVDQFGYLPTDAKVAVISDPQKGYNANDHFTPGRVLQVRQKEGGKVVATGAPTAWKGGAIHEDSGDRGWWFDFSTLDQPGEYYVYDPSNSRRSPIFMISEKVFNPILKASCRMFYYQRLAVPIEAKYSEGPWVDGPAYLQDRHTKSVEYKTDTSRERDMSGGWMDAGDTDKYPPFNGDVIHPLLYAYTANPKVFTDDWNIPESGNGLPDLLDEVKVQLDWLVKMQFADGGVPVKMGQIDYGGKQPLSADARPRYYGPIDSGATIYTCANFAHAARVYGKFKQWEAYAADLRTRAEKSWNWYKTHPRTYKTDTGEIKSGIANRSADEQDRMEAYAAIHLFALTGDSKYNKAVVEKAGKARQLSEYTWSPYEAGASEALVDYLSVPNADASVTKKIREVLTRSATSEQFAPAPETDLYRAWMQPTNYHWGSNNVRASWGVVALLAARQSEPALAAKLRGRAAEMLHSFHGVNPFSCVYLSNMGKYGAERSIGHIYHERYGSGTPFDNNPPPGYVVGGPNQSFGGKAADGAPSVEWVKQQPRGKAYMDTAKGWPESSWELSEPAIYYQAMYVRLIAEFAK
jgi:hypothetical protein